MNEKRPRIKVEMIFKQRDGGWTGHDLEQLEAVLNTRAEEGWRVGQIIQNPPHGFLVFYERT